MSTLVLRATKGSALTWVEADDNFTNINNDKIESIVEDTTPQLGGDLDVNNHNIIATDGIIRLGSGDHSSGRGKGLYYDDIITQNTTDRTYAIYETSSCTATVDVNSTARVRGDVSAHYTDLDGHNANSTSHYHFGGNYMFPGINNSGVGGGSVGVYGGLLIEPSINDDVSITDTLYGLTVGAWDNSSGTINNYVGVAVDPPTVTGSKYSLKCTDADAVLYNAGGANFAGGIVQDANLKDVKYDVYALPYAATIAPDVANGNVQTITLTGDVTFNGFTNDEAGQYMTLIVTQDATGGRTLTSSMKAPGGASGRVLSLAANAIDILNIFYDGTNYFLTITKGFA